MTHEEMTARISMLEEAVFFLLKQMPKNNMLEAFRMEMRGSANGHQGAEQIVEQWIANLNARSTRIPS